MHQRFLLEKLIRESNNEITALARTLNPQNSVEQKIASQQTGRPIPDYPETQEEIEAYLAEKQIDDVMLTFVDPHAKDPKQFMVPTRELGNAFKNGMGFDGSSIRGYRRIEESDMVARPDPNSFTVLPFLVAGKPVATMFADIYTPEGNPFLGDPRMVLKTRLVELQERYEFTHINIGPEPEFYVFNNGEPADNNGYFDAGGEDLRTLIKNALETMGIQVEYHHHEVGPGQHEIDIKYDEALRMADKLVRFRYVTKTLTERLGLQATFMPKPLEGENGSGMHTHLSIFQGKKNLFFDKRDDYHLSLLAYTFMGGVLNHARELALVTNPLANSYKRLVPGFEAPVYLGWSRANRSCMIRIPDYRRGKEEATRIEIRNPDPTANPYLYLTGIITAGFIGISNEIDPESPRVIDLYQLTEEQRIQEKLETLPGSLGEALREARAGELLGLALGSHVYHNLVAEKQLEWDSARREVTPRERTQGMQY